MEVTYPVSSGGEGLPPLAFKVKLKCDNCGHTWIMKCREYDEVGEDVFGVYVYNKKTEEYFRVQCPVCKLERHVRIVSREPIQGDC